MVDPNEYLKQVQEERNKLNEYSQQALRQRQQLDEYSQQALRQQEQLRNQVSQLPTSYSQKELRQTQAGIGGFQQRQKVVQYRTDATKSIKNIDKALLEVEQGKKDIDEYLSKVKESNTELDKYEKNVKDYMAQVGSQGEQGGTSGETQTGFSGGAQEEYIQSLIQQMNEGGHGAWVSVFYADKNTTKYDPVKKEWIQQKGLSVYKQIGNEQELREALAEPGFRSVEIAPNPHGRTGYQIGSTKVSKGEYQAYQKYSAEGGPKINIPTSNEINPEVRQAFEAKYGVGATVGGQGISNTLYGAGGSGSRFQEIMKNGQLSGYKDTYLNKELKIGDFYQHLIKQGIVTPTPQEKTMDVATRTYKNFLETGKLPTGSEIIKNSPLFVGLHLADDLIGGSKDKDAIFKEYEKGLANYNAKLKVCCDNQGNILPGKEDMIPELTQEAQRLQVLKQGCDSVTAEANRITYQGGKIRDVGDFVQAGGYYLSQGFKKFGELSDKTIAINKKAGVPDFISRGPGLTGVDVVQNLSAPFTKQLPEGLKGITGGTTTGEKYEFAFRNIPIIQEGLFIALDVPGTTARSIKGGVNYMKQNPWEIGLAAAGVVALGIGGMELLNLKPKIGKATIPLEGGGERVIWKGAEIKGHPLIGKTSEGRWTIFNPSVSKLNLDEFNYAVHRGWRPRDPLTANILSRQKTFEKLGVSPEYSKLYSERISTGKYINKKIGSEESKFIAKELTTKIGALTPEQVKAYFEVVKKSSLSKDIELGGSFSSSSQLKNEFNIRMPQDIDTKIHGVTQVETALHAKEAFQKLKEVPGGYPVRISEKNPSLIESYRKLEHKDGVMGWDHAIDIHDVPTLKPKVSKYGSGESFEGMAYGVELTGKAVEIENIKLMGIDEQLKRKMLDSSLVWQKGDKVIEIKGWKDLGLKKSELPRVELKPLKELQKRNPLTQASYDIEGKKIILPIEKMKFTDGLNKQEAFKHEFGHFLDETKRGSMGDLNTLGELYKKYPEKASTLERIKKYPIEQREAEIRAEIHRLTMAKDISFITRGEPIKVSALPFRMKDISDTYNIGKTLTESMKKGWDSPFKTIRRIQAERALEKWKSLFPEIDWKDVSNPQVMNFSITGEQLKELGKTPRYNYNIGYSKLGAGRYSPTYNLFGYKYQIGERSSPNYIIGRVQPSKPSYNLKTYPLEKKPNYKYTTGGKDNYKIPPTTTSTYKIPPYIPSLSKPGYKIPPSNPPSYKIPPGEIIPYKIPPTIVSTTTISRTWPIRRSIVHSQFETIKYKFEEEEKKKKKKRLALSWKVLVRRRKAWNYLTGEYTRGEAIRTGAEKTMTTLARTFKIVPYRYSLYEGEETDYIPSDAMFRRYRVIRGTRYPMEDKWIQRAPMSLSSRSEVREIQNERVRAEGRQKMFNFNNRRSNQKWI